jgi:predicted N-acetyltransferase YhbS
MIEVRAGRREDGPALREIERRAGERFRSVGLDAVADDEPTSVEELAEYAALGCSWVAVGSSGEPVGYVLVTDVDGAAHIEQVSVLPDHQGAGVGRALVDRARAWATETGRSAVSLTTFAEVPWNRPLYEHLGFRVLADEELGPELRDVQRAEATRGFGPAPRVCMRLVLDPRSG